MSLPLPKKIRLVRARKVLMRIMLPLRRFGRWGHMSILIINYIYPEILIAHPALLYSRICIIGCGLYSNEHHHDNIFPISSELSRSICSLPRRFHPRIIQAQQLRIQLLVLMAMGSLSCHQLPTIGSKISRLMFEQPWRRTMLGFGVSGVNLLNMYVLKSPNI